MKRRMLTWLTAAGVLALSGGLADAHQRTLHTRVDALYAFIGETPNERIVIGQVRSRRAQCVPDRRVKIFAIISDGSKELKDVARTSDRGYFATRDDFTNARNALLRVTPKNVGRGRHRHVCRGDSDQFEEQEEPPPPAGP